MKNRKVTYLLLAVVAVIWGAVIRSVVTFSEPAQPAADITGAREIPAVVLTDMELLLNYRDPFLGSSVAGIDEPPAAEKSQAEIQPAPAPETIPFSYKGTIGKGKEIYALLDNSGVQETVSKGEEIEGFKVLSVTGDSILLQKEKKRFTLRPE